MELKDDGHCFVCGTENHHGLKLDFKIDAQTRSIATRFVPAKAYQGYMDVVHGGIIATVLDEAMTKLAYHLGMNAVTGKLTVRFKKPLMVGEGVIIRGRILKESGRAIEADAFASKDDGTLVAEAEGLLLRIIVA